MIEIKIETLNGDFKKISIDGHANAGKYGSDIVCAAVSVLAQGVINAMIKALDNRKDFFNLNDEGRIVVNIPNDIDDIQKLKIQTLADVWMINFDDLSKTYSKNIRLEVKEVG